ncbi:hypothetical protein P3X46_027303 [Hevea brasiliensis]|uniref:Leucine-rich repeat-containing N-terminal plant-type domain-containing protein n=1 Tax=Hevea brasiliensis TaxID=3981 RepID=A0ABQ9KZE3_HEVBR|nr:hypothetical protein P3X46_027303 [Hevea brasiliensis]
MSDNMFNGSIPPQLFSLMHLETLNLGRNLIEGSISGSRMGDLKNLKTLSLESNFFNGEILVGNLADLTELSPGNNRFTGAVPSSLCHLKKLKRLDLHSNLFSVSIPSEIGNLSVISSLLPNDNDLVGEIPPSMQKMGQLEELDLEDNCLRGEIPTWLFDLIYLTDLKLGGNKLVWKNLTIVPKSNPSTLSLRSCSVSGHIPFCLSNFTNLFHLDLSEKNLIGSLPPWLNKTNLYELILSINFLSGSLFPLFQFELLQQLDLARNNFSGKLPDNIGKATLMRKLVLSGNDFSGPIPNSISNMSMLSIIDLSNNRFSGNEFPSFRALYLDLSFNKFCGGLPVTFYERIVVLLLSHNEFSGVLPPNLMNLSELACLDVHDDKITGEIPAFLSHMSTLQILNLRNNSFQGPIPNNLTNLTSLQILDLSDNDFSGKVPPGLGNLSGMIYPNSDASLLHLDKLVYNRWNIMSVFIVYPDLEVFWKNLMRDLPGQHLRLYTFLDLSNNQLNLKILNMSRNKLSGRILKTLGEMDNSESLDLSHNRLSGEIPQTFGKLSQLTDLQWSNNELTGSIPGGPQMDRLNDPNFYANNSGLCGMQIQVPCEKALPEPKPEESGSQGSWFSWVMIGIGFPVGFFSTVRSFYAIGYFDDAPKRGQRRHVRQGVRC